MRRLAYLLLTLTFIPWSILSAAETFSPVSHPASLRQQLPDSTVAYIRLPTLWGLFSGEHHSSLQAAQAHPEHQKQVQKMIAGMRLHFLPKLQSLGAPLPILNLLFSDLRAPLEMAVLLPPNAPPTSAMSLLRTQLSFDSLDSANLWLQEVTSFPELTLKQGFNEQGLAVINTEQLPLLLHYSPENHQLHLMLGLLVTSDYFQQTLKGLTTVNEHPMFAVEQSIDSSAQGVFAWVNLEKLQPLLQATLPPQEQQQMQMLGMDKARGIAFGYGSSQSKARLQLVLEAPKAGYRQLLPPITNYLDISAAGEPGVLLSLNIPAQALYKNLVQFAETDMPDLLPELDTFKAEFHEETGVQLEDILAAFGDEFITFTDKTGEFFAIRLADKVRFRQILGTLIDKYKLSYTTHHLHNKAFHHLKTPIYLPSEASEDDIEGLIVSLLQSLKAHYFWVEEGDYLLLAKMPQMLFDRQQELNRVPLKQWLHNTQKQAYNSSLFLFSTSLEQMPRKLYSTYLELLVVLGDLVDTPVDIFALPSASALNLPDKGTYGFNVFLGEEHTGVAFTFENNPMEFLFNMYGMTGMAVAGGVMAAVAIPAYTDYLLRSKVAEGVGLLAGLKTPAEEFLGATGRLPTIEEAGARSSGKYTSHIYLLEDGKGYAAEFYASELAGRVLLMYDFDNKFWTCSGDEMESRYLPTACR